MGRSTKAGRECREITTVVLECQDFSLEGKFDFLLKKFDFLLKKSGVFTSESFLANGG